MPKAIRSELVGRILARLHALAWWPFKDKQFFRIMQEMKEGDLALLCYYATTATDEQFRTKMQEAVNADIERHKPQGGLPDAKYQNPKTQPSD